MNYPGDIKNRTTKYIVLVIIIVMGISFMNWDKITGGDDIVGENLVKVKLETNQGDIILQMYGDMAITTGNFVGLVEKGVYNGVIFHRVIDGFMIQGGDPTGTGYGDSNIPVIQDEFKGHSNKRGTISMANKGPNTGSSQFFINLVDNTFLDDKHPVFGEVVEGMEVVDKIAKAATDSSDRPLEEVKILKASVVR